MWWNHIPLFSAKPNPLVKEVESPLHNINFIKYESSDLAIASFGVAELRNEFQRRGASSVSSEAKGKRKAGMLQRRF